MNYKPAREMTDVEKDIVKWIAKGCPKMAWKSSTMKTYKKAKHGELK